MPLRPSATISDIFLAHLGREISSGALHSGHCQPV